MRCLLWANAIRPYTLVAGFLLAMAFTFSCSSGDDTGGGSNNHILYYDPNNGRCRSGVVEYKCGDVWYNGEKYVCTDPTSAPITWEQFSEQVGLVRCGK